MGRLRPVLAFCLATAALLFVGAGCGNGDTPIGSADVGPLHTINVTARQFAYSPSEIRVKYGEHVRLMLTSQDVTHGLALPDFNIDASIPMGETVTVDFVADKKGTFPFFCSVFCGSGHADMRGMLIVE